MTTEAPAGEASPAPRRTTAHDHKQLAAVLGWTVVLVDKAAVLGVLPAYDLKTPRWRGATVDELVARREELAAALDESALLTEGEMVTRLGLDGGDWRRGRDHGVIPGPDRAGFWTRAAAEVLAAQVSELREKIPPQPLGAHRCASLLADLTGLDVTSDDIVTLAGQGHVGVVDYFKDWELYDVAAVRRLGTTEDGTAIAAGVVGERQAWLADSVTTADAARWLEWDRGDLKRVAAGQGIKPGRFGRWARTDIARLAGDEELAERVRREQLLGPDQAAEHLEIRRLDFEYVRAAGWAAPARYVTREVGRRKTVSVPLFTVGSLEDALLTRGVDWEAVRSVKAGDVSPLREFTRLPAARADVVRAFCDRLAADWQVEVWPHFWNAGDQWQIDWEQRADGHPTKTEVAQALAAHRGASRHAGNIVLSTEVGDVIRQARADLEPGCAVVCDVETTDLDGIVVEIAVIDAATGEVLLDTLVNPDGVPVEPGARAVHGISDEELAAAPRWADIVPDFLAAVEGKRVLTYNAVFDHTRVRATQAHAGLSASQLPPFSRWDCLMEAQSVWLRIGRWLPLGGGHRALGDAQAARQVLLRLAAPVEAYQ